MKNIIIVAASLVVLSCGGVEPAEENVPSAETNIAMLCIETEIGVELGDSNFVFGVIQDLDFTAEGNVVVLDTQKKKIRMFSPNGEFLGVAGGAGEAPGEFLNPRGIACLSNDKIAVTDPFSREVEVFNNDLQHFETVSNFSSRAPFVITAAGDGFAGEQGGFNRDAGLITTSVALWQGNSDSVHVFYERESDFSPEHMIQRIMTPQSSLIADNSNLYYATPTSEEYVVFVYPMDGSNSYVLSFPDYVPVLKSDEDLENDILAYEYRMQSMAASGRGQRLADANYEPSPNYYAISSIGLDANGNIWVQRGWESNPTFDIFPTGATEPVETVIVDPDLNLSDFTFVITPNGMAAFNLNPEDYPRVLILSLQNT